MDNALSLAIGAVAIAPSSPDTIYVGTGEPEFSSDSFFGVGIYRITNASTASPTLEGPFGGTEMSGRAVSEIVVDPANAANIFAATTRGIGGIGQPSPTTPLRGLFRSNNATAATPTFTKLTVAAVGEDLDMTDLAMDPANANRVLVAVIGSAAQSGVWLSTNALGAAAFTRQLAFAGTTPSTARTELAINNVGGVVTVFAASADTSGSLYRSVDGGVNWAVQSAGASFCGSQCFYNIAVAVDPTNANNVYLGGGAGVKTFLYSTNGGTTFVSSTGNLHTDTQALAVAPSSPSTIYFGSDGGIWKSTNSGANWTSLNNSTFRATQFESIAVHPTDPNFTIGGTQDNGTLYRNLAGTWLTTDGGDGGFTAIDRNATDTSNVTMYHGYIHNNLFRRTSNPEGAGGWTPIISGISGTSLFYPPFTLGPLKAGHI